MAFVIRARHKISHLGFSQIRFLSSAANMKVIRFFSSRDFFPENCASPACLVSPRKRVETCRFTPIIPSPMCVFSRGGNSRFSGPGEIFQRPGPGDGVPERSPWSGTPIFGTVSGFGKMSNFFKLELHHAENSGR